MSNGRIAGTIKTELVKTTEEVVICDLGRVPYEPAWQLQRQIQLELVAAKRAEPPRIIPHVMLAVEHPPVYTLGKSGDQQNLLVSEAILKQQGATFVHIDRGGDITFHGPGQLVGYPMLDLDRVCRDIHKYLRNLEEAGIRTCADYGVVAGRVEGKTGVWVENARKICAMGIRCSRWVSMHGFAFNVQTDLKYFDNIVPCGISDGAVTSLDRELGRPVEVREVLDRWLGHFAEIFDVSIRMLDREASLDFLNTYLADPIPDLNLVLTEKI